MPFLNWTFISGAFTGIAIYVTLKQIRNYKERKDDCILFSPRFTSYKCLEKRCQYFSCSLCNHEKFLLHLSSARKSLDICVYLITSEDITRVILRLFLQGIFVRIIVDKQMSSEASKSKVNNFIKNHVPVKFTRDGEMMHNKFVIVDQRTLITGSFNWTDSGTFLNFENAVILHNDNIIQKYSAYFNNLWYSY